MAVPVAAPDVYEELKEEVDEVVCLIAPKPLRAFTKSKVVSQKSYAKRYPLGKV